MQRPRRGDCGCRGPDDYCQCRDTASSQITHSYVPQRSRPSKPTQQMLHLSKIDPKPPFLHQQTHLSPFEVTQALALNALGIQQGRTAHRVGNKVPLEVVPSLARQPLIARVILFELKLVRALHYPCPPKAVSRSTFLARSLNRTAHQGGNEPPLRRGGGQRISTALSIPHSSRVTPASQPNCSCFTGYS